MVGFAVPLTEWPIGLDLARKSAMMNRDELGWEGFLGVVFWSIIGVSADSEIPCRGLVNSLRRLSRTLPEMDSRERSFPKGIYNYRKKHVTFWHGIAPFFIGALFSVLKSKVFTPSIPRWRCDPNKDLVIYLSQVRWISTLSTLGSLFKPSLPWPRNLPTLYGLNEVSPYHIAPTQSTSAQFFSKELWNFPPAYIKYRDVTNTTGTAMIQKNLQGINGGHLIFMARKPTHRCCTSPHQSAQSSFRNIPIYNWARVLCSMRWRTTYCQKRQGKE